ncbi:hypothetical protein VTH82DRAFT_6003 [Thermothelomyces myriococcoides]
MRLLNASTYEVEEFYGSEIPQYAILSHTWGREEVTLPEMEEFAKFLRSRREQARQMAAQKNQMVSQKAGSPDVMKMMLLTSMLLSFRGDRSRVGGSSALAALTGAYDSNEDDGLGKHFGSILMSAPSSRHPCEQKAGFSKIDYACRQAIKDGYRYVWVDTCCIDKRSSAELSEAINSMFDWYQKAAVCYAYLEDVHFDDYTEGYRTWKDLFHNSRWFTRGWTLQELLAPRRVVFYANGWRLLGTKTSLVKHVIKATGIDEVILIDPKLIHNASVAKRMAWAANRSTSRIEDQAYSLLGIFGVNMPIMYGEGSKAFLRLQEEIIKRSDDQSIFAWGALGHPSTRNQQHPHLTEPDEDELDLATTNGTTGVLATSPRDFAGMEQVVTASPPSNREVSDHAMTNKGLRITLDMTRPNSGDPMFSNTANTHLAILNCHPIDDPSVRIGLLLTETATPNVMLRTRTRTATLVPAAGAAAKPRSVYILNDARVPQHAAAKLAEEEVVLVRMPDLVSPGYDVVDVRGPGNAQWNREFRSIRLVGVDYSVRNARRWRKVGGATSGLFQLAVITFWNKHLKCGFLARILVDGVSKVAFVDLVQGLRYDVDEDGKALIEVAKRIWEQPGTVQVTLPNRGRDTPGRTIQVEVVNPVTAPEGSEDDDLSSSGPPTIGWTFRPGHELRVSGSVTFAEKWERDYQRTVNAKVGRTKKGAIELSMSSMLWLAVSANKGVELDQPS